MSVQNTLLSRRTMLLGVTAGLITSPASVQACWKRRQVLSSPPNYSAPIEEKVATSEAEPYPSENKEPRVRSAKVDPPEFLGYAGSYTFGDSGVFQTLREIPIPRKVTLLSFFVSYNMLSQEHESQIKYLFAQKAGQLRDQGLTQVKGQSFTVGDADHQVLVFGSYIPGSVNIYTLLTVPNTGSEGPYGTILHKHHGSSVRTGGWKWAGFTSLGREYLAVRYGDYPGNVPYSMNYTWHAP